MATERGISPDEKARRLAGIARVEKWRDDALADGWVMEPYFNNEPLERACKLRKEGFVASLTTRRPMVGKPRPSFSLAIWGPDGLAIKAGELYDWAEIKAGTRRCSACGAEDVDTERYSFAGRCCKECLPAMKEKHERPGWCR